MKLNLKEKYLIILVVLCFISIGFYYSYAIFVTKQLQENVVVVKVDNKRVTLNVDDNTNQVIIKSNSSKDLKVNLTNNSNINYYYLVLVKGMKEGVKVSSYDEVNGEIALSSKKSLVVHVNNTSDEDVTLEFMVKLGNDSNIDKEMNYYYINYSDNFDHSGANEPEINNNLLPVSYYKVSDTEGYWYKADITNQTSLWYSYENGIWANAVLLSDSNYKKYQNAKVGEKIEISDILGFYVWIPRFKYKVINNSNYTNYERMNNIIFEEDDNSTGTVKCFDRISNLDDSHVFSEVCNDDYYDHIYDNLSTYTHPAFRSRKGFWVSKFLMSDANKSIPNVSMSKYDITEASNLSSKHNSHVLTNMEYGAIILLSNSSYGKTANSLYYSQDSNIFTRIYANSYPNDVTGCSSEYNIHSNSIIIEEAKKCVSYNDLTDYSHHSNSISYNVGYAGAGASSTGNIYGVYDLVSINGELVSGFVADNTGNINTNLNYYDIYSYSDYIGNVSSSSNIYNLYRYKLGDAIREHFRNFGEKGMWNNGIIKQSKNSGILIRGGNYSPYSVKIEDDNYRAPFRFVLGNS